MTSAKEIARAFVEMILSEEPNYLDIVDFTNEYDDGDPDFSVAEISTYVLEYMVEIRENFKNGN